MKLNDKLTNFFNETIYNWVAKNFGESEAEDPSWNIEALAEGLAKHKREIYSMAQEEYDLKERRH